MHLGLFLFFNVFLAVAGQQPNIVYIFMDDFGWNDIGYHGSEIMTPNLDQLAAAGVKLENYYVQPLCSPSRSQFLTGRYQTHTCTDNTPVLPWEIGGLSLDETTLAERLRDVGYRTHTMGKWHLGHSSVDYLPTYRGFDTFYGGYIGATFHFNHSVQGSLDMHDDVGTDLRPVFTANGTYSTYLYSQRAVEIINNHNSEEPLFIYLSFTAVHTPLQAPQEYVDMYEGVFGNNVNRQILAGMTTYADEAIANITAALQATGLWDNTVFIFSSDNGGGSNVGSDNTPLRDDKGSYFKGGIQSVGFITSPLLSQTGFEYTGLLHVSDWMPTLVNLAGGDVSDLDLDGYDVWNAISGNTVSPRTEILHYIDPDEPLLGDNLYPEIFDVRVQASLTNGDWKIMTGNQDGVLPRDNIQLFNLNEDPYESTNVFEDYPEVVETLLQRLAFYNSTAVPPCDLILDQDGATPGDGEVWGPWM